MKILLINPPVREWAKPNVFPLGLGYIAAILLRNNHRVEVMDINAFRWDRNEVENRIRDCEFDAAGIGGIITTYRYVKWLISIIKKYHPDKKIIIGGSIGTSIPRLMLERNPVDVICIGEGEETIAELIPALEKNGDLSQVKGIWYKGPSGEIKRTPARAPIKDLVSLPFPAWGLFPIDIYLKNPVGAPNRNKWVDGSADTEVLSINLNGARGCPYKCIYCYHDFMGQGYRTRSAGNIISEIEFLYNKYGVTYFHFTDDEFVINKSFIYELCGKFKDLMRKTGAKLAWGCAGRVNLMDEMLISSMVSAGCVSIGYGIESGSQKILDLIKKQVTVKQAKDAVRLTQKYIGWADCSFMVGYPGETEDTIQETIDFCQELGLTPEVIFFLTPYPGTELYAMAVEQRKITDEEQYILQLGEQGEKINVNFTEYSNEELSSVKERMVNELKAWNKLKHPESR